ncbi:hypothetical protein ABFS82_10G008200 [Erythranthe guttata]|uniref:protein SCAR2-like isoform X1 n=2 Tax=Erythranthe guttata TaxID=4155 RepID=UPI00064DFED6|nr:PREDICTED: protein SCAR2-like isoform X1 [Erythranthe guttata]|eukprot:XP_012832236.1 PREDICTED: protein SCAR2-like isoform X1 [Erythranthe guttata]
MPMSRYEIRNEYSLADPDLYRTADKDDPEALLEGVAMAGLVGVLRQLGDLAEFAADVFHNLHEEVMATAARGHGLMMRVEQLETEVPSIERAYLSQTDHSSFFYQADAGVDWHPSLHIDQNLVTQGDLPRFIMDSYEECRAPPRLFLLDKFDVAGAGACLKRYTDPSFFKVETSGMTRSDIQREKKIRKGKKKGPRWRNGENPEVLSTSHTKLHQLFMEEHVENGVSNPSRRVKLKRRLNGFPFDSASGKTYMEKFLSTPTPDREVLHEVTVHSSALMLATYEHNESGLEVRPVSPDGENMGSKRSPPSSPDREEIVLNPSMYNPSGVPTDDKICEVHNSYPSIATDHISSSLDEASGEKVIAVDTESNREGSLTGYQSDDIASEVDNYVDAPSTMESEMDTDSELRGKSDFTSSHKKIQPLSEASEEHLHSQSPDSQSTGGSVVSDKGSTSSRNEISSFSSDSLSSAAENSQSEKSSAKGYPSTDIPKNEVVDASSYQRTAATDHHSKSVISDDTCADRDVMTNYGLDFELVNSSLCSNESVPNSAHSGSGVVGSKDMSTRLESDEEANTLGDEEKKANLVMDPPYSSSVSDFQPQSEDDSPRSSARKHLVEERNGESLPCLSTVPDIQLHEDESDLEDHNMVENIASTSDMFSHNTDGTPGMMLSKDLIPSELDDEFPKLPENSLSVHLDIAHNENDIKSTVSEGESLTEELDNKDSNVSAESPNYFPLAHSEAGDAEDNQSSNSLDNQITSENSILLHLANSPDSQRACIGALVVDVIPEKETLLNESTEQTPNDSETIENSYTPEGLEQPTGVPLDEMDAVPICMSSTGRKLTEISWFPDLKSTSEVHAVSDESDNEEPKSSSADMVSAAPAISDSVTIDEVNVPGPNKLGEGNIDDSGLDEFENDKNSISGSHGESGLVETVDQTEAATSTFGSVFCHAIHNDPAISEISDSVPNSHLDLEVVEAATLQSSVDQSGLDRRHEFFQQNSLENHITDASSLQVNYDTEESKVEEKTGLPPTQPDQELPQSAEMSSELSSLPSVYHQQTLDHILREGDNDSASPLPLVDNQSPPSVSELHTGSPGYSVDPFDFIYPPSNPFSEANQINLSDLPPLPPLPPVQWRMTKLQHASSSTEGQIMKHKGLFPPLISPITASTNDVAYPPPTISTDSIDSSRPNESTNDVSSSPPTSSIDNVGSSPPNTSTIVDSSPPPAPMDDVGSYTPTAHTDDVCGSSAPTTSTEDVGSSPLTELVNDVSSSVEEMKHSVIQIAPETASKEEKTEASCSSVEANIIHETVELPPKIENKYQHFVVPNSTSEFPSPAEEDGVTNGSRTVKLPRPRNPLVDDVSALDKSKLRKVTERVRPQIQKVDERDSILEQIRTKSFNLKPAIASRPSTRGPNTNLRVAAILEKANAIRQAFAGSDEDDEDSWSDS